MQRFDMLIDGRFMESLSRKTAIIKNPANQEPVAEVSLGGRKDARLALEAAKRAQPGWAEAGARKRGAILHKAAGFVRDRAEEIALFLTKEQGKPVKFARREVISSAEALDYYAEEALRNYGEWLPSSSSKSRSLVIRQPLGVAALITPWNYPVDLLAWKVAPALAAGCTVVAKPSSRAPLAATEFIRAVHEAGLPHGTLNLVNGSGEDVGSELVENPISRKISFTGETKTGRWIMERAARQIKRTSLELGGHSPFIVCEDASLDEAVEACLQRAFSNMGQICISVNRIYLNEKIAEEFESRLVKRTTALKIGDGLDPETDQGPMFSEAQRKKTMDHIADALLKGAELLCGGRKPEGEIYERGFFFLPTVLRNVDHSMRIMREETFGPVAPCMTFKTNEEALRLSNDTTYGLAAYVFTEDLRLGLWFAERLEAGSVGVNQISIAEPGAPFGGWKCSGLGRERSREGLFEYMETKHIRIGM